MSTDRRLERVTSRTFRIQPRQTDATKPASRFAHLAPDAAKATFPSRFAGRVWLSRRRDAGPSASVRPQA